MSNNDHGSSYSVLTGDLLVWSSSKLVPSRDKRRHLVYTYEISIRPTIPGAYPDGNWVGLEAILGSIKRTLDQETPLDGTQFSPTPLAWMDLKSQTYFRKRKLLIRHEDVPSVHPFHICSRYLSVWHTDRDDAFRVYANQNGSNGWILVPLTPDELKDLPGARQRSIEARHAEANKYWAAMNDVKSKLKLDYKAKENAALEQTRGMMAAAWRMNRTLDATPQRQTSNLQPRHIRSHRNSLSGDMKKSPTSSRRSSLVSSSGSAARR